MIRIRNLRKSFLRSDEEIIVLNDVTVNIEEGDFVMLLGESGSGKTTFLNILGGLDTADDGRIEINGIGDILSIADIELSLYRNRFVGHIFQTFNLKKTVTVYENVKIPMLFTDLQKNERHDRIMHALKRVGLAQRPHFKPPELSEGQCQRVAIARAIVNKPKLLLADEPTGNLDPKTARIIMELLLGLTTIAKTTLIMVTHDESMLSYAKKALELKNGKITEKKIIKKEKPTPTTLPF